MNWKITMHKLFTKENNKKPILIERVFNIFILNANLFISKQILLFFFKTINIFSTQICTNIKILFCTTQSQCTNYSQKEITKNHVYYVNNFWQ